MLGSTRPAAVAPQPGTTSQTPATPDAGTAIPFYRELYDQNGKINPKAFDRLPDELREHKDYFSRYHNIEDVYKTLLEQRKALSTKSPLVRPGDDAPEPIRAEFAQKLRELNQAPEKPDGYDFSKPETFPENMPWPDSVSEKYQSILHKHNAPAALAQELRDAHAEFLTGLSEENEAQIQEFAKQAKAKLGHQFAQLSSDAMRGLRTIGFTEDQAHAVSRALIAEGMAAEHVQAFAKIVQLVGEDRLSPVGAPNGSIVGGNGMDYRALAQEAAAKAVKAKKEGNYTLANKLHQQNMHYLQLATQTAG